jgi:steroid 5-alpha reductase family enzyme
MPPPAILLANAGLLLGSMLLLWLVSLRRRPGYREYVEITSGFVPWLPKRGRKS